MTSATWGTVLFLLENAAMAAYGRPSRWGNSVAPLPLAQFRQWPDVYQAAIEANVHVPGKPIEETVLAITHLLGKHYPLSVVRRWPLSDVAAFLQRMSQTAVPSQRRETVAPPIRSGAAGCAAQPPISQQGSAEPTSSIIAADKVGCYLGAHPSASMEEVNTATGLSEPKIRRTQAWKDHEGARLDEFLKQNPHSDTNDVKATFGFSPSKTCGMCAWKAHQQRRKATRPPPPVKERPLTRSVMECRPAEAVVDSAEQIDRRDQIFRTLLEDADPPLKARLNGLSSADREALLEHILSSMDNGSLDRVEQTATREILLEVTRSWLEEQEQQRRHQHRREQA